MGRIKLTENFYLDEFLSKDGAEIPQQAVVYLSQVALVCQEVRDHFGEQVTINSGWRSEAHNKAVGGSAKSQHLLGKAADIVVKNTSPDEVWEFLHSRSRSPLEQDGFISRLLGGLGRYDTFTHIDIRDGWAEWDYRK